MYWNQKKLVYNVCLINLVTVVAIGSLKESAQSAESLRENGKAMTIFHHPDPHVLDGFGMAIAGYHHRVLVGIPNQVHRGHEAGRASLFDRKTGHLIRMFDLPEPTDGALFGQSVALTASEVLIGTPHGRDGLRTSTGGVYVFDHATGKLRVTIQNPQPVTGTFGHALATKGTRVVIGDPQASTTSTYYTGAAYVFDVKSGERLLTLRPPNPIPGKPSRFGHAVAFSESMIVVGAPTEHTESGETGMVYGFNTDSGAVLALFANPQPAETSFFGWSVAGRGHTILIGAFGYQGTYREEGIAYVFDAESGKLLDTLKNPEPRDRAHFGQTVAILPHLLAVGAPGASGAITGMSNGAVYLFGRTSGTFLKKMENPAKPTGADDLFGKSLASANGHLLVGAPFSGVDSELDAGLVYQFDLTDLETSESSEQSATTPSSTPPQ